MTRGVRNPTRSFDTGSMEIGGWEDFLDMTADAPGERSIEIAEAGREFEDKAEYEAFMNEPVGIVIEAGGDRDPTLVPVGVNGHQAWLPRGRPIMVRRYHLERLLRSTVTEFTVTPLHDPNLDEGHVTRNRNRGTFHITIARDTNPKGAAWAGRMRREGC